MTRREGLKLTAASTVASLLPARRPRRVPAHPLQPKRHRSKPCPTTPRSVRFQVSFPETDVTELRRRIKMTRWPEHELVSDAASRRNLVDPGGGGANQGVQLATMQNSSSTGDRDYDLSRCEAHLKSLPPLHDADRRSWMSTSSM